MTLNVGPTEEKLDMLQGLWWDGAFSATGDCSLKSPLFQHMSRAVQATLFWKLPKMVASPFPSLGRWRQFLTPWPAQGQPGSRWPWIVECGASFQTIPWHRSRPISTLRFSMTFAAWILIHGSIFAFFFLAAFELSICGCCLFHQLYATQWGWVSKSFKAYYSTDSSATSESMCRANCRRDNNCPSYLWTSNQCRRYRTHPTGSSVTAYNKVTNCTADAACKDVQTGSWYQSGLYCPVAPDLFRGDSLYLKKGETPEETLYLSKYVSSIDGPVSGCSNGNWILRQADAEKDYIKLEATHRWCWHVLTGFQVYSDKAWSHVKSMAWRINEN